MTKTFWTEKRLDALSKTSLNLFSAFIIGSVLSGVLGKINSVWIKILFGVSTLLLLVIGILLADLRGKKEE